MNSLKVYMNALNIKSNTELPSVAEICNELLPGAEMSGEILNSENAEVAKSPNTSLSEIIQISSDSDCY